VALSGALLLVSFLFLGISALAWRIAHLARREASTASAKAIVMLGARVLPSGQATPALQYRAHKAAELYLQGRAPLIIFSGGSINGLPSEATVARELAVAAGVPPEACVLEEQSRTTHENAVFTAPLLKSRGIDEALLVTDAFHLYRAQAQFRRLGISTLPVPSGRQLSRSNWLTQMLREALVMLRRPWLLR